MTWLRAKHSTNQICLWHWNLNINIEFVCTNSHTVFHVSKLIIFALDQLNNIYKRNHEVYRRNCYLPRRNYFNEEIFIANSTTVQGVQQRQKDCWFMQWLLANMYCSFRNRKKRKNHLRVHWFCDFMSLATAVLVLWRSILGFPSDTHRTFSSWRLKPNKTFCWDLEIEEVHGCKKHDRDSHKFRKINPDQQNLTWQYYKI